MWLKHLSRRKRKMPGAPAPASRFRFVSADVRKAASDAEHNGQRGGTDNVPSQDEAMTTPGDAPCGQPSRGNSFAPIASVLQKGGNILYAGCATEFWARDIALAYPGVQVYEFDLEAIPTILPTSYNYHFYQGNLLYGLPFRGRFFGYAHIHLPLAGILPVRLPWVLQELKRVTCPGGWIEVVEMSNEFLHPGPATQQFFQWWRVLGELKGIDAFASVQPGLLLESIGLENVQTKALTIPVGDWGGEIGVLLAKNLLACCPGMRVYVASLFDVPVERFDQVVSELALEWNRCQTACSVCYAFGQVKSVRDIATPAISSESF